MKKIIVIPTYYRQIKFYLRMKKSMIELGYEMHFFVYKLSLYLLLKKHGAIVFLVKKCITKNLIVNNDIVDRCVEYNVGQISKNGCKSLYEAMFMSLEKYVNIKENPILFIWNGSGIDEIAATDFAKKYSLKTLYFEVANIPKKIFIDKKGTNAQSYLFYNKHLLDRYNLDKENYLKWKENYLEVKFKNHIVPQSKSIIDAFQIRYLIDIVGNIFITKLAFKSSFITTKLNQLKNNIMHPIKYDEYDYKNKKYIFFPLQVSYDSQIVLNSNINLMEAFQIALKESILKKYDLVIKPHPQEANYTALKSFFKYKDKFILMNENTFLLMKYAQEVWTINSTVGLEALIIGKNIKVLGKAIYRNFSEKDLIRYLSSYLVDIDFFGEDEISISMLKKILNRV